MNRGVMSNLEKIILREYPPKGDSGWIEYALYLLWDANKYESVPGNAAEELAALRARVEELEAALADKTAWVWKCRECGNKYPETASLPLRVNPSGIKQEACPACDGAVDLTLDSENQKA